MCECERQRKRQTRGTKPENTSLVQARSFIRHRPRILLCQLCVHCAAFRNTTPADDLENLPLRCIGFNTPLSDVGICVYSDIPPFFSRFYIYIISVSVILCSSLQPQVTAWGPVYKGVHAQNRVRLSQTFARRRQQHFIRLHFHCQLYQTNASCVLALNHSCGFVDWPKPGDSVQQEAADTKKGNHGYKHLQSLVSVLDWGADVHLTGRESSS